MTAVYGSFTMIVYDVCCESCDRLWRLRPEYGPNSLLAAQWRRPDGGYFGFKSVTWWIHAIHTAHSYVWVCFPLLPPEDRMFDRGSLRYFLQCRNVTILFVGVSQRSECTDYNVSTRVFWACWIVYLMSLTSGRWDTIHFHYVRNGALLRPSSEQIAAGPQK